jgi:predicted RNA methylase
MFINSDKIFNNNVIANNNKNFKTFRIVISNENVLASVNEKLRAEAEKTISRLSGLSVNRSLPDTEFWFLYRSENDKKQKSFSVFMKRLTLRASWEKTLHKGELPPPLAWTLCRLASLSQGDAALDPFCGCGSIPDAAAKYFHITNITACDNSQKILKTASEKLRKRKGCDIKIHNIDFRAAPSVIESGSIDAIITDPPWGLYQNIDNENFYKEMFDVFSKLLKCGGSAVILYNNDEKFLNAALINFDIIKSVPILLSGKKAVIYVLIRK